MIGSARLIKGSLNLLECILIKIVSGRGRVRLLYQEPRGGFNRRDAYFVRFQIRLAIRTSFLYSMGDRVSRASRTRLSQ